MGEGTRVHCTGPCCERYCGLDRIFRGDDRDVLRSPCGVDSVGVHTGTWA